MIVYIGPHKKWIGPYQIAELLMFWCNPEVEAESDRVHKFGEWLATNRAGEPSTLAKFCEWVHSKQKRTTVCHIHKYDTWNMDTTLAPIINALLVQLKATKHGGPYVDPLDVPIELRPSVPANDYDIDDTHFARWDWVLDEMIHSFAVIQTDWESQFHHGVIDFTSVVESTDADGKPTMYRLERGPKDTSTFDWEGHATFAARIKNGFRLFGTYYQNLWD